MKTLFLIPLIFLGFFANGQLADIPAPLATFYHSGNDFSWHHEVVNYFNKLQQLYPDQVKVESYGKSYEGRPLILVYIGNKENISKLSQIQKNHLERNPAEKTGIAWLSYNVHGNESCGTEAAMETAYLLLTKNAGLLDNTLVIIDPCLNPDGRDRYVNYFKQYHGIHTILDEKSAEHQEAWPSGRANHYLFDLNRDWAWLTQIESQARIPNYNAWLPHVHVDFHEQGMNEPYYFPPAAEPYHEVITQWQRDFQKTIGNSHAAYFDQNGWLYFSKEIFDLLYPSYGDTYPTYNGAIGMTYEQGGSGRAGLGVITMTGDTLTLKERIEHHTVTGISTVEMVSKHNERLIKEFQNYFSQIPNYKFKSYVLDGASPNIDALLDLLVKHGIPYQKNVLNTGLELNGFDFFTQKNINYKLKKSDIVINLDHLKGTIVNVLFEPTTKLSDSLTYDITAWSLPFAYGISTIGLRKPISIETVTNDVLTVSEDKTCYAYAIPWKNIKSARFLSDLLQKGFKISYAEKEFSQNGKAFQKGTLLIIRGENDVKNFDQSIIQTANLEKLDIYPLSSGKMDTGNDLGSYSVKPISKPTVGVLMGENTSSLSVGEVWYFLDQQLNYPIQLIKDIDGGDIQQLSILFIPEGFNASENETLKEWIKSGGTCIVMGSAASAFMSEDFGMKSNSDSPPSNNNAFGNYGNLERSSLSETIIGAIYKCDVDESHPLAFGYGKTYYSLKLSAEVFPFQGTIVQKVQDQKGWVTGFVGSQAKPKVDGTPTVGIQQLGNGNVIYFFENPLFRGFWENGKLQVANAIFFLGKQ